MAKTLTKEVKAQIAARLKLGDTHDKIAADFGVERSTVSRVNQTLKSAGADEQRNFGRMIEDYLFESLTTLNAQQVHFRDKDWLKTQNASDLAILHGVTADKAIRIIRSSAESAEERASRN